MFAEIRKLVGRSAKWSPAKDEDRDEIEEEDAPARLTRFYRLPKHPAELRLRRRLPQIIGLAKDQVRGAISALDSIGPNSPDDNCVVLIARMLGGPCNRWLLARLRQKFTACLDNLSKLSEEHICLVDRIPESPNAVACYFRNRPDWLAAGEKTPIFGMAYICCGFHHSQALAYILLHEETHRSLGTTDERYDNTYVVPGAFHSIGMAPLVHYARENGAEAAMKNGDSVAALIVLLYFESSKNPDFEGLYNKQVYCPLLEFHKLRRSSDVRISTPELNRPPRTTPSSTSGQRE